LPEVEPEGLVAQRLTTHLHHELSGIDAAPQGVDPLLQPLAQSLVLPGLQERFDGAEFSFQRFAELGADQMAERIGGEVAEEAF
jgi:hypothetical protein